MTQADDLQRLVERIEGTSGGSRELDCAIGVEIGRFFPLPPKWDGGPIGYGYLDTEGSEVRPGNGGDQLVPRYTASIDAAMTLVEGELFGVELFVDQVTRWGCILSTSVGDGDSYAATLALAITAASLRARITQENSNG